MTDQSQQLQDLQRARQSALKDSCRLLRSVVLVATPPGRQAQAAAFIARTPLHDCATYATNLTRHPTKGS